MNAFLKLTKRNVKLFFSDKGMFFPSLITPLILLVLYATFLRQVYYDSFVGSIPTGVPIDEALVNGTVGGELLSSLLAVSCITVSFCSNLVMVQDKANGAKKDLLMTPVKSSVISVAYYCGTVLNTLIICFFTAIAGFVYLAIMGWYLSFADILLIFSDIILLTLFGVALSSLINVFLSTQGQMSAVGTIVSSGYGFICGAYMPISGFSVGLRNILSLLPGTYGTSLIRNHTLRGVFREMSAQGYPEEVVSGIKESIDCIVKCFGQEVSNAFMYIILIGSVSILTVLYILIAKYRKKKI